MQTITPISKQQQVFLFDSRLNSGLAWLITIAVVLGSARGMLVIHAGIAPYVVYTTSSALLLSLAAYGIFKSTASHGKLTSLKTLMAINLALGAVHLSIDFMLQRAFNAAYFYLYLAPYIIFLYIRMPMYHFRLAVALITLAISLSIAYGFIAIEIDPRAYDMVVELNMKLRPDDYQSTSLSSTGNFYRIGGYTGSYHDSANILGMVVVFSFINFLLRHKIIDFGIFGLAAIGMAMTQSAANIVIAIFTACAFSTYLLIRNREKSTVVYILLSLLAIVVLNFFGGGVMSIFLARIGPEGDWDGMLSMLNFDALTPVLLYGLLGRVSGFSTEVALINLIFDLGLVPALLLFILVCYPLYLYSRIKTTCLDAIPALSAVFFGFLSLIHYGSIFRVTSIFLFYYFYAAALFIMRQHRYYQSQQIAFLSGTGVSR